MLCFMIQNMWMHSRLMVKLNFLKRKDLNCQLEKKKKKELSNIMCIKQKSIILRRLLCVSLCQRTKKFKNYINSHQAQNEAVYRGVEKVLFEDGRHLHYRRYNSFDCIKQNAATGVRLLRWDTICFMKHYYKFMSQRMNISRTSFHLSI